MSKKNNLQRHESRDRAKWVVTFVTIVLLVVALAAAFVGIFSNGFENWDKLKPDENEVTDNVGAIIENGEANGIMLTSSVISPEDYADYGVNALAESAYTLTIQPIPDVSVDTYLWVSSDNESITLSPSEDTKSCVISCNKAFSTQITITVTSNMNEDVFATSLVDYVKRITSVNLSIEPNKIKFNRQATSTTYTINAEPVYTEGTITPNFEITGGVLKNNVSGLDYDVTSSTILVDGKTERVYTLRGTPKDFTFTGSTFTIGDPYDAFIGSTDLKYIDRVIMSDMALPLAVQPGAPTVSQLKVAYKNSLSQNATGTGMDGTLVVNYKYSYTPSGEDTESLFSEVTGSAELGVAFDVSDLAILASEINVGNIVF